MTHGPYVVLVSEDELSDAVLRRLLAHSGRGFVVDRSIIARGFGNIKARIGTFRTACRAVPHLVLADLDLAECVPGLLNDWRATELPDSLLFRVAVREVEAWLMADRSGLADYVGFAVARLPAQAEAETDPKRALINAARRSRKKLAREIVPAPGSAAPIGPLYNAHMIQFVQRHWNVEQAAVQAPSLGRTLERLQGFLR